MCRHKRGTVHARHHMMHKRLGSNLVNFSTLRHHAGDANDRHHLPAISFCQALSACPPTRSLAMPPRISCTPVREDEGDTRPQEE